jgi:hypothetical protein
LLKLVPPDVAVVLTVDDLRGQVRELLTTPLAADFQKLPAVTRWFESEKYEQLATARDQIEGVLRASLTEIRDQVLGDGVVCALHLPAEGPIDPQRARGVLLLKARDPALLSRLIDVVNKTQKANRELASVVAGKWQETSYFIRQFAEGSNRPAEIYVTFPDGTFAFSNSETIIQEAIDRKSGKIADRPDPESELTPMRRFQALERRLPDRALLRLYVDARKVHSLIKNSSQAGPARPEIVEQYLGAMETAGAAMVVRDGRIALQTAEVFESRKFQDLLGRWSPESTPAAPNLARLPATTLAVGSLHVDFLALYEMATRMVPDLDKTRVVNLETALRGILLGQDVRSRILPRLGPRLLAFVDTPSTWEVRPGPDERLAQRWPFPTVLAIELQAESTQPAGSKATEPPSVSVAAALENAFDTLFALLTFDDKRGQGRARIISRDVGGVSVKSLDPPISAAFAIDRKGHRLVVGSSPEAVERYLLAGSGPAAGDRFSRLRDLAFPEAHSFLCVDLAAAESMIVRFRRELTDAIARQQGRSGEDVARDLEQVIDLSKLFDAAYLTNRIDAGSATVYHSIGLLARQPGTAPPVPKP